MSNFLGISNEDLEMVETNFLTPKQMEIMLMPTPKKHIRERKSRNGQTFKYVSGSYTKKILNLCFGWNWSHEVVEHKVDLQSKQVYVLGKLIIPLKTTEIFKMQFGRVEVDFKKDREGDLIPIDIGNDLKSATTDSLKKCASELGFFSDIYSLNDFQEFSVKDKKKTTAAKLKEIEKLLNNEGLTIDETQRGNIERIVKKKEVASYDKALIFLKENKPKKQNND